MSFSHSFANKKVLVAGGGRGIGKSIVKKLYEDGALVYTIDRDASLLQSLKAEFPKVITGCVDVCDWNKTKETIENFGVHFDHLVNNCGTVNSQNFLEVTPEILKKSFDVNLFAIFNIGQVVGKGMIEANNGGTIVNMASIAGVLTVEGISVYSCSKAAVIMLTKSMALELGVHNIRVNSICPTGVADTFLLGELPASAGPTVARAVLKRPVTCDEVANVVLYLLSPLSSMITGEDVLIDGGVRIN